jgi:hypothetical protein
MPTAQSKLKSLSFIAVGPPRTGTTWLHEALVGRANLPRHNKETKFFDIHYAGGFEWYVAHFEPSSELPAGEVCPTYFCSKLARERIAELAPRPRIICTFRDPVVRIFSHYKIKRAFGDVRWPFEEALSRDPELMESSRYAFYLAEWQREFGKENVLPAFYEDLASDPQGFIDRIAAFIGMPQFRLEQRHLRRVYSSEGAAYPRSLVMTRLGVGVAEWLKAHNWEKTVAAVKRSRLMGLFLGGGGTIESLSPATRLRVREALRPEVEALEKMLDRDLSAWKWDEAEVKPRSRGRSLGASEQ